MLPIEALRPTSSARVMDLVNAAGVDVSDWGNFKGGPAKAASNPRYCYEWSFVEPNTVVVLNLWLDHMKMDGDRIVQEHNFRADAAFNRDHHRKPQWYIRATRIDQAVQTAIRDNLPIRVIVNTGEMRKPRDPNATASRVQRRGLDPVPWTIEYYDPTSGQVRLARGLLAAKYVDQFNLEQEEKAAGRKKRGPGEVYARDPAIRAAALKRAGGRCEHCNQPGFAMANGSIYLETHHIRPLSGGGPDSLGNAIVLCPNDHKRAHFAVERDQLRQEMSQLIAFKSRASLE